MSIYANPIISIRNVFLDNRQQKLSLDVDIITRAYSLYLLRTWVIKLDLAQQLELPSKHYVEVAQVPNKMFGSIIGNGRISGIGGARQSVFNANYQFNPVYFDEVSLAKFTEEFLDTFIEENFTLLTKAG